MTKTQKYLTLIKEVDKVDFYNYKIDLAILTHPETFDREFYDFMERFQTLGGRCIDIELLIPRQILKEISPRFSRKWKWVETEINLRQLDDTDEVKLDNIINITKCSFKNFLKYFPLLTDEKTDTVNNYDDDE